VPNILFILANDLGYVRFFKPVFRIGWKALSLRLACSPISLLLRGPQSDLNTITDRHIFGAVAGKRISPSLVPAST